MEVEKNEGGARGGDRVVAGSSFDGAVEMVGFRLWFAGEKQEEKVRKYGDEERASNDGGSPVKNLRRRTNRKGSATAVKGWKERSVCVLLSMTGVVRGGEDEQRRVAGLFCSGRCGEGERKMRVSN
ncbi:hypothetical protein HAX54_028798 [Datura stramonium]|uniref:Uncharacterized protein n=1 Tax=Datura stramonium TaxID=4076 RepID=A0ABS8V4P8_DATST|nr:hypothetical protein [Datura stramonium]